MLSDREVLVGLVGKTIVAVTDIGEWKESVYVFMLRFSDGSSLELRPCRDETLSVLFTEVDDERPIT